VIALAATLSLNGSILFIIRGRVRASACVE